MTIALPIGTQDQILGTAVIASYEAQRLVVVTSLHILGSGKEPMLVIPLHGGDCSQVQVYPIFANLPAWRLKIAATDPSRDLAFLIAEDVNVQTITLPKFITSADDVKVGEQMVVLAYPFGPIGSVLETWTPCYVSGLGQREFVPGIGVREQILTYQAHPGSSGGAVIRLSDGRLCGIIRGNLAPPSALMMAGGIPIGTDSSVTFATSADIIPGVVQQILSKFKGATQ